MTSKQTIVTLLFVLATGCVTERPEGDDDGGGSGSGSGSALDPTWVESAYVGALAADDTHLYFANQTGGTLARKSLAGGAVETLFTAPAPTSQTAITGITAIYLGPNDIAFVVDEQDYTAQTQKRSLMTMPKAGGAARQLSTSQDSRAYLGATVEGSYVYFSTFTALLRVPLAGGTVTRVGESPNSVQYWAFSPTIIGDQLYWAELNSIYRVAANATDDDGRLFANLPGGGKILGTTPTSLVVGLSDPYGLYDPATQFAEVDLVTGNVSAPIAFGEEIEGASVSGDDVFAATFHGAVRVPRSGGAPVVLTTEFSTSVTATDDAVFVGTSTGITRIER
jgi:hypothetical protein